MEKEHVSGSVTFLFGPETQDRLKEDGVVADLSSKVGEVIDENRHGVVTKIVAEGDQIGFVSEFENHFAYTTQAQNVPVLKMMGDEKVGSFKFPDEALIRHHDGLHIMTINSEIDLTGRPGDAVEVQITFPSGVESDSGTVDGSKVTWTVDGGEKKTITATAAADPDQSLSEAKRAHESWNSPANKAARAAKEAEEDPFFLLFVAAWIVYHMAPVALSGLLIGLAVWFVVRRRRAGRRGSRLR